MVGCYAVSYYSSSHFISLTFEWVILGINILLLLSFMIWDYRIKKRKVSKFNQALILVCIIATFIFSMLIFYF